MLEELTSLDCQSLCYALKAIEVWWHKTEQMRSLGSDPAGGFAHIRLERAIFDGALTAYLRVNPVPSPFHGGPRCIRDNDASRARGVERAEHRRMPPPCCPGRQPHGPA
jgi:hypothetical protein